MKIFKMKKSLLGTIFLLFNLVLTAQVQFPHKDYWWGDYKVDVSNVIPLKEFNRNYSVCQPYLLIARNSTRYFFGIKILGISTTDYLYGDASIQTNKGTRINFTSRSHLNWNWNENGSQTAMAGYFLTKKEFNSIEQEGIRNIFFKLISYNHWQEYSLNSLNITF